MEKGGRVFVVQASRGRNVLGAAEYGKILVLLPEDSMLPHIPETVVAKLKTALATFSDEDYLLLMGSPMAIGIATSLAGQANNGRVAMLLWDRQTHQYFEVRVNI